MKSVIFQYINCKYLVKPTHLFVKKQCHSVYKMHMCKSCFYHGAKDLVRN